MSSEPIPPTARVDLEMTDQSVQQAWNDFAATDAVPQVDGGATEKHHRRNRRNHPTPST